MKLYALILLILYSISPEARAENSGIVNRAKRLVYTANREVCSAVYAQFARRIPSQIPIKSKDWNQYPQYSAVDLNGLTPIDDSVLEHAGSVQKGLATAIFEDGTPVFIKAVGRNIVPSRPTPINEYQWLTYLNSLGLGPKVFGVTKLNGKWAVVMEKVEGYPTQAIVFKTSGPPKFKLTQAMVDDIRNAARILETNGVVGVPDFQFILTPEGRAVLIDPEWYFFQPLPRIWTSAESPTQSAERLIEKLMKNMTHDSSMN